MLLFICLSELNAYTKIYFQQKKQYLFVKMNHSKIHFKIYNLLKNLNFLYINNYILLNILILQ